MLIIPVAVVIIQNPAGKLSALPQASEASKYYSLVNKD